MYYTKYDSAFYYKNPEIQLVINLQRVKDELGSLLHVEYCDRCMGLKCKCLDVATVEADSADAADTAEAKVKTKDTNAELTTKDASADRLKDAKPTNWLKSANKARSTVLWTKDTKAATNDASATWFKDVTTAKDKGTKEAKWSFKFSSLDIDEDIWRRADRYRRPLEERYLTSETVEEFFLSIRKRAVKCS